MRSTYPLLILLFLLSGYQANSQIRLIVLDQYNLKKGDTLQANLSSHVHLQSESAPRSATTLSTDINLFQKSKKINLNSFISADHTILKYKPELTGPALLEISQKSFAEYSKEEYLSNLKEQGLVPIAKELESILNGKDKVKDSATFYTKSLVSLDKKKPFSKDPITNDHEITLKSNPFGATYGDQLTAVLTMRGKPLPNAPVILYVKARSGNIISELLRSDAEGMLTVKLDIEGVYFLQHLFIANVSTNNEISSLWSTFSFEFVNNVYQRSTYSEFGF
ncbi:DUF4198 domain-containing protein [Pedobacter steynii]|uniref:DUF4198 domain-containing protein n=1 Tax=Pedobacter steynii TaxID=430522 RepID=A0A1D7QKS1_9SPHI|nr:DUF4198 domain-containing protein [Pedobacter steynii]AOM79271.1 hypothetical protein BFS30_20135 [Pedobacter steynii]